MMRDMGIIRAVVVAGCLGAIGVAGGCVAKNGSEVQARGSADTGTTAPATRPTNTNASSAPTAGGTAAAQSAAPPSTSGGDVAGQVPESTAGTPMTSDTAHRRRH
jgi:hypothetical protein